MFAVPSIGSEDSRGTLDARRGHIRFAVIGGPPGRLSQLGARRALRANNNEFRRFRRSLGTARAAKRRLFRFFPRFSLVQLQCVRRNS